MNQSFADKLLNWFDDYGRHDLPWQQDKTAYRVWVSEIMLQQTQVQTVIPYYQRFMSSFPDIATLASAQQEEVLAHWAGLGYYARGRNLHKAAQLIMSEHGGVFPTEFEQVVALPGIGRSTAGAILSIAIGKRYPILDGNVKRVLARFDAIEQWPGERETEKQMWLRADELTPEHRFADYTQAIMDLGATLCTRSKPQCLFCPMQSQCQALAQNRVAELPKSKPKKEKPTKQTYMLIRSNSAGEVWLQQRPQDGIWGGLWSLPEFESWQALEKWVQSHIGEQVSLLKWQDFRHTFSHYHLQIHPVMVVESGQSAVTEPEPSYNGQWCHCDSGVSGKGVPAPVQLILQKLQDY